MQRAVQWTYYLDNSIFVAQQLFMCCHGFWWVPKMLKSLCSKYPKGLYINNKKIITCSIPKVDNFIKEAPILPKCNEGDK